MNIISAAGAVPAGSDAKGWTLLDGTTYYAEVERNSDSAALSVHIILALAMVATVTFEDSNVPGALLQEAATANGYWVPEDPSSAEVEYNGADMSATGLVITKSAGTAIGTAMVQLSGWGARRGRLKIQVTTGGNFKYRPHEKWSDRV